MLCRFSGSHIAWFLVGSHNLSKQAWGEMHHAGLRMGSFEASVLMLPELEAAFRRHPQRGYRCTPDASNMTSGVNSLLRCPADAHAAVGGGGGSGGGRRVGTLAAVLSPAAAPRAGTPEPLVANRSGVEFYAALQGPGEAAAAEPPAGDGSVTHVPLPLPFALPPPPYQAGDVPFAAKPEPRGVDCKGRTFEQAGREPGCSQDAVRPYFSENN
jgi:Tyrosyl-DNA phosphodiesterase